jgi:hypothetical protein
MGMIVSEPACLLVQIAPCLVLPLNGGWRATLPELRRRLKQPSRMMAA